MILLLRSEGFHGPTTQKKVHQQPPQTPPCFPKSFTKSPHVEGESSFHSTSSSVSEYGFFFK